MKWALIGTLVAICAWLIIAGMTKRGKAYELPFLIGAITLGFVVPQLPALAADPFLPDGALEKTIAITILCVLASYAGWAVATNRPAGSPRWTLDERRLFWAAAGLTLIGAFFFYRLSRLPYEMRSASQLSGLPVAYLFFAKLLAYGFGIAVLCFFRRTSHFALAMILLGALFYLDRIIIAGRRAEASEFIMLIVLAAWFQRRLTVPRGIILTGVLMGTFALHSTGSYRAISESNEGRQWSEVLNIDVVGNLINVVENGGPELRNAVSRINTADRTHAFDYGAFHWNTLVYNFVPAQLVGSRIKDLLLIPIAGQFDRDYNPDTGSTETGMTDAFASFWYFGVLKFFVIAYVLGRIYVAAMAGRATCQLIYLFLLTPAMHAITHNTQVVLSAAVHMAMFLLPVLALTRVSERRAALSVPAGTAITARSH